MEHRDLIQVTLETASLLMFFYKNFPVVYLLTP